MAKTSTLIFNRTTTWTAPAGVTYVNVTPTYYYGNFIGSPLFKSVDGVLYSWGRNESGQIGDNTSVPKSSPVVVAGNLSISRVIKRAARAPVNGAIANGILDNNGNAYAWGFNASGQLGDNTAVNKSSPILVQGGLKFTDLIVSSSSFGITAQGQVYGWGANNSGQLGLGDVTPRSSPVVVSGGLTFTKFFDTYGQNYSFGLTSNGSLYSWGLNISGVLGVGDSTNRSSPTLVQGGLTFVDAFPMLFFCFGIDSSGNTYAWGDNSNGQLGLGDITPRSSPVIISGGLKFVDIQPGILYSSVALDNKGDAYAWGSNTNGQLGINVSPAVTAAVSSPTLVVGGLKFKKISAASGHTLGLTTNGVLYAWGLNSSGQLGVGDTTPRSSPTVVSGGLTFSQIFAYTNASFGITSNGLLYAWGVNTQGYLGVNDNTNRSSPTLVSGNLILSPVSDKGIQNMQIPTRVSVTPGTTYTITFNHSGYTTVNNVPVSFGPLENLIFSYEQ